MGQIKNIKLHIVTDIKVLHLTKTTTMPGGVTVKDVNPQEFVRAFAAHLKKSKLKVPEYVEIVESSRTRTHRSRLVLRPRRVSGPTCLPPSQRRCRSHPKDLRGCKEERNAAGTLLFVVFKCCEESFS